MSHRLPKYNTHKTKLPKCPPHPMSSVSSANHSGAQRLHEPATWAISFSALSSLAWSLTSGLGASCPLCQEHFSSSLAPDYLHLVPQAYTPFIHRLLRQASLSPHTTLSQAGCSFGASYGRSDAPDRSPDQSVCRRSLTSPSSLPEPSALHGNST